MFNILVMLFVSLSSCTEKAKITYDDDGITQTIVKGDNKTILFKRSLPSGEKKIAREMFIKLDNLESEVLYRYTGNITYKVEYYPDKTLRKEGLFGNIRGFVASENSIDFYTDFHETDSSKVEDLIKNIKPKYNIYKNALSNSDGTKLFFFSYDESDDDDTVVFEIDLNIYSEDTDRNTVWVQAVFKDDEKDEVLFANYVEYDDKDEDFDINLHSFGRTFQREPKRIVIKKEVRGDDLPKNTEDILKDSLVVEYNKRGETLTLNDEIISENINEDRVGFDDKANRRDVLARSFFTVKSLIDFFKKTS